MHRTPAALCSVGMYRNPLLPNTGLSVPRRPADAAWLGPADRHQAELTSSRETHLWPCLCVQVSPPHVHIKAPGPGLVQNCCAVHNGTVHEVGRATSLQRVECSCQHLTKQCRDGPCLPARVQAVWPTPAYLLWATKGTEEQAGWLAKGCAWMSLQTPSSGQQGTHRCLEDCRGKDLPAWRQSRHGLPPCPLAAIAAAQCGPLPAGASPLPGRLQLRWCGSAGALQQVAAMHSATLPTAAALSLDNSSTAATCRDQPGAPPTASYG